MSFQNGIELSAVSPVIVPEHEQVEASKGYGGWIVTVFNNDENTYDEVIMILMVATGCTMDEAYLETWEVDHLGRSVVHHGGQGECKNIGQVISSIGLRVEISEE